MSWFRLDDEMPTHPKIGLAGGDACWLWVCAGCWCAKWETNGRVPKHQIARLSDRRAPMKLAERLVTAGMFEDAGDYFLVHDYLDFNPSADEVAARREKRAEAGRAGGKQSGTARRSKREASASANVKQTGSTKSSKREPRTPNPLEEPVGSSRRGYTKAERDPVFAALIDVFGEPKTKTTRGFFGASVTELLDAGASPAEVLDRGRRLLAKGWPDCTPKALLKHWGALAAPGTGVDPDSISRHGTA